MNIKEASGILVLDPIHGAEVITEELKELGKEAEIFNPYHTFKKSLTKNAAHASQQPIAILTILKPPNWWWKKVVLCLLYPVRRMNFIARWG